ncbi:MAG TPA: DUF4157 domain-containing protein [Kofleriaceae bacterium]|nr:DUF4157 domain-containing protein [Kofleriaceae bacterium]
MKSYKTDGDHASAGTGDRAAGTPGKQTLTQRLVRRKPAGSAVAPDAQAQLDRAASSSGAPLPAGLQSQFESSLGAALGGVRLHTGDDSASAANAVGARAYTVGQDIHFNAGQYDPSSQAGQHLLAHEVAHTVQQGAGGSSGPQHKLEVSMPGDAHEVEADRAADAMLAGRPAEVSAASGIQREPAPAPANEQPAADGNGVLDAGEKALAGGTPETVWDPNDLEGNSWSLRFQNDAVQALLKYLITKFLGEADPAPLCLITFDDSTPPKASVPPWVKRFRTKAISVNTAGAPAAGAKADPGAGDQPRMSKLASQLADAILPKTDGEKFREEFLAKVKPGTSIMSQDAIDKQNKDLKDKGQAGHFTTCIAFAGSKVSEAMAAKNPSAKPFRGPNGYKEVTPGGAYSLDELPPGSWKDAKSAAELPKPGDMLVLNYAEKDVIGKGTATETTVFPGYFAHVNILRDIQPVNAEDPMYKAAQAAGKIDSPPDSTFVTVDGGGTVSTEGREFYNKANQRLDSRFGRRSLKGWFDVAVMVGAKD